MSEKKVTVRLAMEGGKVVEAELVGLGKKGAAALGQLDKASAAVSKSSNEMRFMVQNSAYQVQDFFVQVAGGTSATRALSQQLPQLLGSMGLIGVLAGTAAAALIPLGAAFFGVEDDAKGLEQALKALDAAMSQLKSADKDAASPIRDLVAEYGKYAEQAGRVLDIQREVARVVAQRTFAGVASSLSSNFGGGSNGMGATELQKYADLSAKARAEQEALTVAVQSFGSVSTAEDQAAYEALLARQIENDLLLRQTENYRNSLHELADAFGISEDAAGQFAVLAARISEADNTKERAAATQALALHIFDATNGLQTASDTTLDLYMNLLDASEAGLKLASLDLASPISFAADEAVRLAKNLWAAMSARVTAYSTGPVFDSKGRNSGSEAAYTPPDMPTLDDLIKRDTKGKGGGGRSGGTSDAQKQANDLRRDAIRLTEQLRTDTEKYGVEQEKINAMLAAGYIDAETYQRALTQIGEKYGETGNAAKFFKDINADLKESILDFATTGVASLDKVVDAIKRAAAEALIFGTGPLSGLFGGGGGGAGGGGAGLLGGLLGAFGGARARGGDVSPGQAYLVGELGPEPFIPAGRGTILPTSSLAGSGKKGGEIAITVNVTGARGNAEIEQMVQSGVRSGVQQALGAYDREVLPVRIKQINSDGRKIG